MSFVDRKDAGRQLAQRLQDYNSGDIVVIAIPKGGVVIGSEIAEALDAPLSVVFVRKIRNPGRPEETVGAITEHEPAIYNTSDAAEAGAYALTQAEVATRELLTKRRQMYFGNRWKRPGMAGKTVILVDDGIATGLTMRAAVQTVRADNPARIIIAVPAAAPESLAMLNPLVDDIIVLENPNNFLLSVGAHYINFEEVSDAEVKQLLRKK